MRFHQRFDIICACLTVMITAIAIAFGAWIFMSSTSSFLPAWITILLSGLILLVITSIPKSVEITPDALEIHCVMELTYIPLEKIASAERVKFKSTLPIPILGLFGFFGYYGYYLSLSKLRFYRVYARNWRNIVIVETTDRKRYLLSIPQPTEFLALLQEQKQQILKIKNIKQN